MGAMTSTLADLEQRGEPVPDPDQDPIGDPAFDPTRIGQELADGDAASRLRWGLETFGSGFVLTTSFGIQSAVLLHQISRLDRPVPVIWVDTGYLPPETYRYAETLTARLDLRLTIAQAELSPARMEALHGQLWRTGTLEDM
jgi:phosphoadenosine phosphosulfate reductase